MGEILSMVARLTSRRCESCDYGSEVMSVPELSELEPEPEPEPEFEELSEGGLRPTSSCMRGNRRGVSSNSAQPPLNPISTTLVNIRVISSFLN